MERPEHLTKNMWSAPWHKTSVLPPPHLLSSNSWKFNGRFAHFAGEICVTYARCPLSPCVDLRSAHPGHADGRPARVRHPTRLDHHRHCGGAQFFLLT